jgi:hypothetical protein
MNECKSLCDTRLTTLRKRYVLKAIHNNNPIIKDTISEYLNFSGGRYLNHKTLLCDMREQCSSDINIQIL